MNTVELANSELAHSHFFQVVTGNPDRAHTLQTKAIPGGKSVHIPFTQTDENTAKTIESGKTVSLWEAVDEVTRISEHKALRDWQTIGGAVGAVSQLAKVDKEPSATRGFAYIARMTSDTLRLTFDGDDNVRVYNKMPGVDLYTVAETMSEKKTAVLTALTQIVAPLNEKIASSGAHIAHHMRTVVVMTEYWLRNFTQQEYFAFVVDRGISKMRDISGALPFERNPFVDLPKGFQVTIFDGKEDKHVLLEGTMWSLLDREQCVHAAFPEAVAPLFA